MKRWSIAIVIALLVAVPLVLAACGSSSDDSTPAASPSPSMAAKDIVDTAVGAGDFTTLVSAVTAAGLVDTLKGEGPYTVFAPTDAAFAAVPKETLDALLADPKGALTDVLTYHVASGKVMASDLSDGMMIDTVNGAQLEVKINADGTVMIGDATVTTADIETSNGVIHVIDTVLVPPASKNASPHAHRTAAGGASGAAGRFSCTAAQCSRLRSTFQAAGSSWPMIQQYTPRMCGCCSRSISSLASIALASGKKAVCSAPSRLYESTSSAEGPREARGLSAERIRWTSAHTRSVVWAPRQSRP